MQRSPNPKTSLPALAFGNRSMHIDDSVYEMRERLKHAIPGLLAYESLVDEGSFRHHSSTIAVNGMKIVASASTATRSKVGKLNKTTLIMPFAGKGELTVNGFKLQWEASKKAVLLPNCGGISESTDRSILIIDLDPDKLELVARGMLGSKSESASLLSFSTPREIDLHVGRISFEMVFRQLASLLDQFILQPELLDQSGIDDSIYRNVVMMLHPNLFLDASTSTPTRKYARRLLDRICLYIQTHLDQPITLDDLEKISCMSRRKLHYAFLKRYNCTPMQWVRNERLTLLHEQLSRGIPGEKVSSIALNCGFNKLTSYVSYYKERFGELPGETFARASGR
jgi:AraC-like DNA-binding protein